MKLTADNIVSYIGQLPKDRMYSYVNPSNKNTFKITEVISPDGPVYIKRFNPEGGGGKTTSISGHMIRRVAGAFSPGRPLNIDRILGASYNTRSVLESLLLHTPQFYYCYPGRIESTDNGNETVKHGHKHIIWLPEEQHAAGKMFEKKTDIVISEIPGTDIFYDEVKIPESYITEHTDFNSMRRHTQIQIALIKIGMHLGFRTWIANNDRGITYNEKRLSDMEGVIESLENEKLIASFEEARRAAFLIDCIWFKNGRLMPAVMEIEHTTGVTSGLSRMKNLQDKMPPFPTRYVVVAPDDDREKVFREALKPQFKPLNTKYFPYSAVEELLSLCERRNIRGVTDDFLDSFMEPTGGTDSLAAGAFIN